MGGWGIVVSFIGVKTKDYPQVPVVSFLTRWLNSVSLWNKSWAWWHKCPPRGSGSRTVMPSPWAPVFQHTLCSWLQSSCAVLPQIGPTYSCANKLVKECSNLCYGNGPLWSFDYIALGLGESRLSFRITNLFLSHSQACAGSFFIQSGLFFQVFQARLLLFRPPFGLLWHMPQSFALLSGF